MSNYKEFVNNYMKNKNAPTLKESVDDIINAINKVKDDSAKIRDVLCDKFVKDYKSFVQLFGNIPELVKDPKKPGIATWKFKSGGQPKEFNAIDKNNSEGQSAFTEAYMSFFANDLNIADSNSKIRAKISISNTSNPTEDENYKKVKANVDDFCEKLRLPTNMTKADFNKSEFCKKLTKELGKLAKTGESAEKLSFSTRISDWERFGKVITYKSVEMLSFFATKDTKLDQQTMRDYMSKVFDEEDDNYFNQIEDIDELMNIDAALGAMEAVHKKGMDDADTNDEADKDLNLDTIKMAIKNSKSGAGKNTLLEFVERIQKKYGDKFDTAKKQIEAAFDKGRTEILESEKADTEQNFTDPLTNTSEKRIGRLGSHGPMTFIKNNEKLNKSVEAIKGQQWNIFNCAAKLLIKFLEVIEEGSKGIQKMKQDIAEGLKQMRNAYKSQKLPDYKKRAEDIPAGKVDGCPESKEGKVEAELENMSVAIRKYENDVLTSLNELQGKPWFAEKDGEDGAKMAVINGDIGKAIQDKLNVLKGCYDVWNATVKGLETIVQSKEEAPQEAAAEEQAEEGVAKEGSQETSATPPQQAASYKNPNTNIIKEAGEVKDSTMADTEKAISDAGGVQPSDAPQEGGASNGKDAKDNAAPATDKNKQDKDKIQNDKDAPKFEVAKWRDQKFNFDMKLMPLSFGKMTADIATVLSKTFAVYAKYADGDVKSNLEGLSRYFGLLNTKKKLEESRYLLPDESVIKSITAGQFMDGCEALLKSLNEIVPLLNKIQSLGVTIPKDKQEEFITEINAIQSTDKYGDTGAATIVSALIGNGNKQEGPSDKILQQIAQGQGTAEGGKAAIALTQNLEKAVDGIEPDTADDRYTKFKEMVTKEAQKAQKLLANKEEAAALQKFWTTSGKKFDSKLEWSKMAKTITAGADVKTDLIRAMWWINRFYWIRANIMNFKNEAKFFTLDFPMLLEGANANLTVDQMIKLIETEILPPLNNKELAKKAYYRNPSELKKQLDSIMASSKRIIDEFGKMENKPEIPADLQKLIDIVTKGTLDCFLALCVAEALTKLAEKAKGEGSQEGGSEKAEGGKEGAEGSEQPNSEKKDANMKDNLNWLANEFYKYIRG